MSPLTSFTIFMQLPLDIRVVIWRLAMPRNRIVRLYEEIEVEDDDATWFETGTSRDSTVYSNEYLDRVLSTYRRFSNRGQTQLEAYNFTSTTPRPSLLTDDQLEQASKLEWETTRQGRWRSSSPIPVLLYVCRESRDLLQAYGYKIAFSTRTAKAQTWFNFSEDYLYLLSGDIDSLDISVTLDGGYWNIGQLCSEDLGLVKRLALSLDRASDYRGSRSFPTSLYHAVQIFGNLEELLLVCRDSDYLVDPKYAYGVADDWRTGLVAVDVQAEEYFGHYCDWDGEYSPEGNRFREGVSFLGPWPIGDVDYSFGAMAKDIEKKLQNHEPLANGMGINRGSWKTPKVRIVLLMNRDQVGEFRESRRKYRELISRTFEATSRGETYVNSWSLKWLDKARKIFRDDGWPPPYTKQWYEASAAMLEIDSEPSETYLL